MGLFAWSEEYSRTCPDIDREHKALFRLAEELQTAIDAGVAQPDLRALFARLVAYTRFHFDHEEALMREKGFPDIARHAMEHTKLAEKVARLERKFDGGAEIDMETMRFLHRWLQHHICGTDQQVARFIRGPQRPPGGVL